MVAAASKIESLSMPSDHADKANTFAKLLLALQLSLCKFEEAVWILDGRSLSEWKAFSVLVKKFSHISISSIFALDKSMSQALEKSTFALVLTQEIME